ncbi:putative PUB domain-containing protein [Lupinus albus]|uniref:Putative PUB domain-containing protein n=1 Tax=Lupinus albus TaxID=3870 RepID=A0A6A4NSF8_LUPAL|nr:putative PUB domain-containing protein [Lupinus albus]
MVSLKVNEKLLKELESMGIQQAHAIPALYYSGNTSAEKAINWLIYHDSDADIDEKPLVDIDIPIESIESFHITEEMRITAQKLRGKMCKRKEKEEKKMEKEREKLNRSSIHSIPSEVHEPVRSSATAVRENKSLKLDHLRECLRSLKYNLQGENARVIRAFETLRIYVGNVAKNPDEEKYRKIRLSNPVFQERIGSLKDGMKFLELCGFERRGDFLYLPYQKVDITLLNSAGFVLNSASTNPFFGILSTCN